MNINDPRFKTRLGRMAVSASFLLGVFFLPALTAAQSTPEELLYALTNRSFEIRLEYSDKYKALRRAPDPQYKILGKKFVPSRIPPEKAELAVAVVGEEDVELTRFGAGMPSLVGVPKDGTLAFFLQTPYFPDAKRIDVYYRQALALSIDVSAPLSCVEDGICRSESENASNCSADCKGAFFIVDDGATKTPAFELPVERADESDLGIFGSAERTSSASSSLRAASPVSQMIFGGIFFVLALLAFFFWLVLRARAKAES